MLDDVIISKTEREKRRVKVKLRISPLRITILKDWRGKWTRDRIVRPIGRIKLDNILNRAAIPANADDDVVEAYTALQRTKAVFSDDQYTYVKCLGYGGMGLALHFRYDSRRPTSNRTFNIVIKVSLDAEYDHYIRKETRALRVSQKRIC